MFDILPDNSSDKIFKKFEMSEYIHLRFEHKLICKILLEIKIYKKKSNSAETIIAYIIYIYIQMTENEHRETIEYSGIERCYSVVLTKSLSFGSFQRSVKYKFRF